MKMLRALYLSLTIYTRHGYKVGPVSFGAAALIESVSWRVSRTASQFYGFSGPSESVNSFLPAIPAL